MNRVEVNPPNVQEAYLEGVERCFDGWGGLQMYRWAFQRRVGAPAADLMVIRGDGGLVAGSAVSYRRARLRGGAEALVGIMTGSWTLPEARGQGCFSQMIAQSVTLAADRGAAALLAFVTRDNASARRLLAAGAAGFPTYYCYSDQRGAARPPVDEGEAPGDPGVPAEVLALLETRRRGAASFVYPDAQAWMEQFLGRPGQVQLLGLDSGGWCVREHAAVSDRIHLLAHRDEHVWQRRAELSRLLDEADARGRQLFCFSTLSGLAEDCKALGLHVQPGLITALVADGQALGEALGAGRWPGGASQTLADPASPWYLGAWRLDGGDRV